MLGLVVMVQWITECPIQPHAAARCHRISAVSVWVGGAYKICPHGAHAGEYPTMSDWANHLTTIFPDVRACGSCQLT